MADPKKTDTKSEAKKARYRVRGSDIKHGEQLVREGDEIELTDDEAKDLKRWIAPADGKSKAAEGEGDPQ